MGIESLDKLEERITKAIARIEKLSETKKLLEDENTGLKSRVGQLEEELKRIRIEKDRIETEAGRVSERVKEKVEVLLERINRYEQSQQ